MGHAVTPDEWIARAKSGDSKLKLDHAELSRADLSGVNLTEAILTSAALTAATLNRAHLRRAILRSANLASADLTSADLRGADLSEADLREARLKDADLSGASLKDAKGLSARQLAGADLTGARVDRHVLSDWAMRNLEATAQQADRAIVMVLTMVAYAWLTIGATSDLQLVANGVDTALPILGTQVPVAWAYIATAAMLLMFFAYLHVQLQQVWDGLAVLPAVFPDGRSVTERLPGVIFSFADRYFPRLMGVASRGRGVRILLAYLVGWVAVPITLTAMWARYGARQDFVGALILSGATAAGVGWSVGSWLTAGATLRCEESGQTRPIVLGFVAAIASLILCGGVSASSTLGSCDRSWDGKFMTYVRQIASNLGVRVDAKLRGAEVSERSADGGRAGVRGADLSKRSLRCARASGAYLEKADLRRAALRGADLSGADLRFARIIGADLVGAKLVGAKLKGATLVKSDVGYADLRNAGGLTQAQLDQACASGPVRLSRGLVAPPQCGIQSGPKGSTPMDPHHPAATSASSSRSSVDP